MTAMPSGLVAMASENWVIIFSGFQSDHTYSTFGPRSAAADGAVIDHGLKGTAGSATGEEDDIGARAPAPSAAGQDLGFDWCGGDYFGRALPQLRRRPLLRSARQLQPFATNSLLQFAPGVAPAGRRSGSGSREKDCINRLSFFILILLYQIVENWIFLSIDHFNCLDSINFRYAPPEF